MKRYGLIGEKLGHSFSKIIHEQLADYTYDLIPLSKEEFAPFMETKNFTAINVTIPYKKDVIPYLDEISDAAKAIGAVNCIVNKNGRLFGHNTDYAGFLYTLRKNNIKITGEKVLVLGNGGAAKAVVAALQSLNPKELITVKYKEEPGTVTYEQAAQIHADASVIVNTADNLITDCSIIFDVVDWGKYTFNFIQTFRIVMVLIYDRPSFVPLCIPLFTFFGIQMTTCTEQ